MTKKSSAGSMGSKRKPHNARVDAYCSLEELLTLTGAEPRELRMGQRQVIMPRTERLLRVVVARALDGNVRELTQLLRIMAKHPALAATFREEFVTVLSGALAKV